MSSGSQERVTYKEESVWGDYGTGTLKEFPHTGITGQQGSSFFTSRIVRADRRTQDISRGTFGAALTLPFELLYRGTKNGLDDFFKYALQDSAWSTPENDVTGAATNDDTVTKTGAFNSANWAVGNLVRLTLSTGAKSVHVITAKSNDALTVSPDGIIVDANTTVEHETCIVDGTTVKSVCLERNFRDVGEKSLYPGAEVNTFDLAVSTNGPVSGSFGLMAKIEDDDTASMGDPVGANVMSTNRVFDSVGHLDGFWFGTTLTQRYFVDSRLSLSNGIVAREVCGVEGYESLRNGSISLRGDFNCYFSSNSELSAYKANTEVQILFSFTDSYGNTYAVYMPSAVVTACARNGGGKDTDVRVGTSYEAKAHATYDYTLKIARWDA